MTPKQESFYWGMWRKVCAATGWEQKDDEHRHAIHMQALGRDISHKRFTNRDFDRVLAKMKMLAEPNSLEARMTLDRYEEQQTRHFGNRYQRIASEDDPGERKRLVYRVNQLTAALGGEAYVIKLCRDMFQTPHWSDIPIQSLTQLRDTMMQRFRAHQKQQDIMRITTHVESEVPVENCPF